MKIYRIKHELAYKTKYAWSDGYSPFEPMPFLAELSDEFKKPRLGFWSVNPGEPGMTIYQGGSQWPDCMGIGLGWPHDVFSDRVVADLEDAGVEVWRKTLMPIAEIKSKRLQKKSPPMYYVLEAERGIMVDFEASGIPMGPDGKPDHRARDKDYKGPLAVKLDSWNGKDLFSTRQGVPMVVYCTQKVKGLAEKKGWTNVKFEEIPVV